jgi:hypothetical protein
MIPNRATSELPKKLATNTPRMISTGPGPFSRPIRMLFYEIMRQFGGQEVAVAVRHLSGVRRGGRAFLAYISLSARSSTSSNVLPSVHSASGLLFCPAFLLGDQPLDQFGPFLFVYLDSLRQKRFAHLGDRSLSRWQCRKPSRISRSRSQVNITGVTINTCNNEDTMPPSTGVASGFFTTTGAEPTSPRLAHRALAIIFAARSAGRAFA